MEPDELKPAKPWRKKYVKEGASMELTEHLDELRDRIIWCLLAAILGFVLVGIPFNGPVLLLLELPFKTIQSAKPRAEPVVLEIAADGSLRLDEASRRQLMGPGDEATTAALERDQLVLRGAAGGEFIFGRDYSSSLFFFNPIEPFMLRIWIAVLLALLVALPVIVWNVWRFTSPGLTDKERTFVRRGLQSACLLFPTGVVFAYFLVGYAIYFLLAYGEGLTPAININDYVRMTLMLMVVMGLVFEFPLILLLMLRVGMVRRGTLENNRPVVVAVLLILSAILTPPDPFTMFAVATPLYLLFELTLIVARSFRLGAADTST